MQQQQKKQVALDHPLTVDGATITSLTMRRPLVRDLRAAQRAADSMRPADVEIALFGNLCEVAPDALDGMDLGDYDKLVEAYEDFRSRGSTAAVPERS